MSLPRFFLSLASLSFALYLIPGLWGAPLKGVSAFVPPLFTQDFSLYAGGEFSQFDDFDKAMEYASENNRPVLVDFSGYGCVNCRKMEGAVFDTPEVSKIIKENFVLVTLMVGDKWSYLQRYKFGANSQPYYVMLGGNGQPLALPYFYDENVGKFVEWLNSGIRNFNTKDE